MSDQEEILSFDDFVALLSDEFELDPSILVRSSSLITDCGLDSMGMYELLLILEEEGFVIDEDSLFGWVTIGDVYETCKSQKTL
jgi:acyl carrier protein